MEKELINTKEITRLFNLIGKNHEFGSFNLNDIEIHGVKYSISKQNDTLTISSSDGRKLVLTARLKYSNDDGYFSSYALNTTEVKAVYSFVNNNVANLEGIVSTNASYDDLTFLTDANFRACVTPELITAGGRHTKFGWDGIPEGVKITDESITLGAYTVDKQGKEILAINGEVIPTRESIESFDFASEEAKLLAIKDDPKYALNDVTKKAIDKIIELLKSKSGYLRKSNNDYEMVLRRVNELITDRFNFINGMLNGTYKPTELNIIINNLERYLTNADELKEPHFSK